MKFLLFSLLSLIFVPALSQNLQLHYDLRHTLDPETNPKNFPSLNFEYFKNLDTVGTGSFLFKVQADLKGTHNNVGQVFTQISQSLRFWKPKLYLSINYSGGLGALPDGYGFYISNSFGVGVAVPFQWRGAWLSASVLYRYNAFDRVSHDTQFTFYFGKGFLNYKVFVAGSFVFWTENRNQGNEYTRNLPGKKFAFFGDPQCWIRIRKGTSVGSRINVFYHVLNEKNKIQFYPTAGLKHEF
jgi:hypothetical protein